MPPLIALLALALTSTEPTSPEVRDEPLRVVLRGGPKTHGEGEHDHPRFVEEWVPLLEARGCEVAGTLAFPDEGMLADADVLVLYAAEGAAIHGEERARLERFLGRGGGLVVLHDAVCGDDPHWFKTVAGGAWEHGRSKWLEGEIGLCFTDVEHPITRGVANFDFTDEIYWDLHLDPGAVVLANSFHTPFDVTPQMWVYEKDPWRAFVSIQGHEHTSFSNPAWRTLLLRGIAWAGRRDADALVTPEEVAALRYPPGGPLAPERAAEAIRAHPDFQLSLVAAEPLVVNPISIDWDARGRPWVATTPGYPYKEASSGVPAHDQVLILEDRDGDGRMDASTVFADGLDLVTSLVFHEDGVIVSQSPEILFLRDTDGDDRADERVVLYSGFGIGDTHAVVSNLRRGPDGWVYATQGYSGNASRNVVGLDGVDHGAIGNGLFRFKPDGSAIEMVSAYGSNTWGLDFTWDGELFFTMANGSHLRHVVQPERHLAAGRLEGVESWKDVTDHDRAFPLRSHERPPYQQIDFVGGFTAASGSCLYTGGAWPAEFDGNHFVCEPTINLVHRDVLGERGVTFGASKPREPEFIASTDLWFRPVHLRVAPDGSLWLLDFYNQAAVHNDTRGPKHGPTNAAVRPDRDAAHGRIWRVQHRAARPQPTFPLTGAPQGDLVTMLASPNGWRRDTARRLLCEADELAPTTVAALQRTAVGDELPRARVAALWTLVRAAPADRVSVLQKALDDPHPAVRRNALTAIFELPDWELPRVVMRPESLLDERDPRARLAGLTLFRRVLPERAYAALLERVPALDDGWSRSAVLALAVRRPTQFVPAALNAPPSENLTVILRALARRVARGGDLGAAVELLTTIAERGARAPERCTAMLEELAAGVDADAAPWGSPQLDTALIRLLTRRTPEVGMAVMPLAVSWSRNLEVAAARDELAARLAGIVQDEDRPVDARLSALVAMLSVDSRRSEAVELGALFLEPRFPLAEQARAIEALGRHDASAGMLCARLGLLSRGARERALAVLGGRPEMATALVDALDDGTVAPSDLGPQGMHRLRHHPDAAIARRAGEVLDRLTGGERDDKDALIAELAPLVDRPGDPGRGREVFAANCATCHTARGVDARGGVGPDLTGMGTHGARELLPFLIDPNRAVEPAYLEYVVETDDGKRHDGVIVRETADTILLRSSTGEVELYRDEIVELRSTGRSPMPTGFETLGADALRDLVAFLQGEWEGFRVIDLKPYCSSSTSRGMYDTSRDAKPLRFRKHGIVDVGGVPFEILDPAVMPEERNVLTLGGGLAEGWQSRDFPRRIELELGYALARLHVLGGIAAWGWPFTGQESPAVKLTWNYSDGRSESVTLVDGQQFADWIRRHEVPGSRWVDVLEDGWGQVRTFTVAPGRPDEVVRSVVLESFGNHLAPTFVALTAELPGAERAVQVPAEEAPAPAPEVLVFGGGSSHDFTRWFAGTDVRTLTETGRRVAYTERADELAAWLDDLDVLVLCNNRALPAELRPRVEAFVEGGGGLVLVHASTWYNWPDWPSYNAALVGGGARSHEDLGEFSVHVVDADSPLTAGIPSSFTVRDELYRFEADPSGGSTVLAVGRSLVSGAEYPVLWTRSAGEGRVVVTTLGHDGGTHEHAAFRALLRNAVEWVGGG